MGARIRNIKLHPQLAAAIVIYLGVQIARRMDLPIPELLNSYLTDLLCIPILLGLSRIVLISLRGTRQSFLDKYKIGFAFVYVCIVFEFWLPSHNAIYTSDIIDILCYGIGAIVFYKYQHVWFPIPQLNETKTL